MVIGLKSCIFVRQGEGQNYLNSNTFKVILIHDGSSN